MLKRRPQKEQAEHIEEYVAQIPVKKLVSNQPPYLGDVSHEIGYRAKYF